MVDTCPCSRFSHCWTKWSALIIVNRTYEITQVQAPWSHISALFWSGSALGRHPLLFCALLVSVSGCLPWFRCPHYWKSRACSRKALWATAATLMRQPVFKLYRRKSSWNILAAIWVGSRCSSLLNQSQCWTTRGSKPADIMHHSLWSSEVLIHVRSPHVGPIWPKDIDDCLWTGLAETPM